MTEAEFIHDLEEKIRAMRQLREAAKYSQQDVADLLGVHQSRVARWERAEEFPRFETLVQLCRLIDTWQLQIQQEQADAG